MAKKPMVTRTITFTKVTALVINPSTREASEKDFKVSRTYRNDVQLMAALEAFNTADCRIVSVIASEVITELYGMTEDDFIAAAKVLPPRTAQED